MPGTKAKIGSIRKLDVMSRRYAKGQPLWHPDDTIEMSEEHEQLSKPKMQRQAGMMRVTQATIRRRVQDAWTAISKALASEWNITLNYREFDRPPSNPGTFGAWVWSERKRLGLTRKRLGKLMGRTDSTVKSIESAGDGPREVTRHRVRAALTEFEANQK